MTRDVEHPKLGPTAEIDRLAAGQHRVDRPSLPAHLAQPRARLVVVVDAVLVAKAVVATRHDHFGVGDELAVERTAGDPELGVRGRKCMRAALVVDVAVSDHEQVDVP